MNTTTTITRRQTAATTVEVFFEAWDAADFDTLYALSDPTIVIGDIAGLLYSCDVYVGHSGVADAVRELDNRWHRCEMYVADAQQIDADNVRALLHVTFEKHEMSFDADIPVVCELRDGRVVSLSSDDEAYAI